MDGIRQAVGATQISASVGFAASCGAQESLHALMLRADSALYTVKGKGRGGYAAAQGEGG
ncbi:hypothetical protein [Pedomonas mirosovicensis]|uniref:hypothetical protein n=1 Tax=Pedomonas mirosovicensis TaxID=2908641 RepID=UPI002167F794|nr:hypothetical protein [Pedomonas mirosovicensis]MCH8684209.1 hypothetical protein [Pedomonas mirosovicensis]